MTRSLRGRGHRRRGPGPSSPPDESPQRLFTRGPEERRTDRHRGLLALLPQAVIVLCLACGFDERGKVPESTALRPQPPGGQGLAEEAPRPTTVDGERPGAGDAPLQDDGAEQAEGHEVLSIDALDESGSGGGGSLVDGSGGGAETGAPGELEGAPKSRVKVRLRKALGSVDRAAISRVIAQVAKDCHRRALRVDPETAGRLELKFTLIGDYKGPVQLKIGGEEELPRVAVCLREGMAAQRWPTGHLDGVGIFEARVDLSVDLSVASGVDSGGS